jgi:uncharacterized membrane protein YcaP (DUF421 family)
MDVAIRAAAIYVFLWLATKAMGKRELSQMSSFELLLLVIMGDLVQQAVTQDDRSVTGGFIAVGTLALVIIALSWVSFRSTPFRKVLEGSPVVVVREGEVLPSALRSERVTVDEVQDAAREQGISDLAAVHLGILEADGRFSFLLDEQGRQAQRGNQDASLT